MTPPAGAATARARVHAPPGRIARRPAPAVPRRVSGPVRHPRVAPAPVPARAPSLLDRLLALPDHRLVCALVTGRAWIWLLGAALGGIVFMQVSLLRMNAGIGRAVETAANLERRNAELEASIAGLSRHERIATVARGMSMEVAPAGSTRFLTVRLDRDALRAVERMRPPGQFDPQVLAAAEAQARAAALVPQTAPAPGTGTAAPAATAAPAGQPAATPAPAAQTAPTAQTAPPTQTASTGGAAATGAPSSAAHVHPEPAPTATP